MLDGAYVVSVKPGSQYDAGAYVVSVKPGSQYDAGAYVASVKPGSQYNAGAYVAFSFGYLATPDVTLYISLTGR